MDRGSTRPAAVADVRSVVFALAGTFVLRCASYGAGIIIPVFLGLKSRTDSEVTASLASLVAVTFYLAELVGAPLFGHLSDRYGRRFFMLLGPLFGGIAIQLLGFSSIVPVLIVVRVLEGFSTASSAPSTLGYLSSQTVGSDRLRGRVMGFYEAATVVGLASGAALGGRLYEQFHGLAFTIIAAVYGASLVLFAFVRDHGRDRIATTHHTGLVRRLLNRRIMRFAPAWLAANAVLGAWFSVGPFLAAGTPNAEQFLMGGYHAGQIGMAFLIFGVLFTIGAITWGFVMPHLGRQATLMWGVGGLGFTSVMLWILNVGGGFAPRRFVFGAIVVLGIGVLLQSGFTPAALAYLAEIAEEQAQDRGSVMGLYSVLLSIGQLVGGAVAGPFGQHWGANGLIVLTGLLCLIAAFTVSLLGYSERRQLHQRAQAEPAA